MPENERTKGVSTLTGAAHLPQKNGTSAVFPGTVGGIKEVVFPKVRSHLENCDSLFLRVLRMLILTASLRTATARNRTKMFLFFKKKPNPTQHRPLKSERKRSAPTPASHLAGMVIFVIHSSILKILPNPGLSKNSEILPNTGCKPPTAIKNHVIFGIKNHAILKIFLGHRLKDGQNTLGGLGSPITPPDAVRTSTPLPNYSATLCKISSQVDCSSRLLARANCHE